MGLISNKIFEARSRNSLLLGISIYTSAYRSAKPKLRPNNEKSRKEQANKKKTEETEKKNPSPPNQKLYATLCKHLPENLLDPFFMTSYRRKQRP